MKKNNQSGQSMLEYSAIAVFVMVGIIAAGPNVVRSVNSYFKTAQEQAQDSFREDITQTPLVGAEQNYDLGDCTCNFSAIPVCGNGTNCQRNQWAYELMCTPATCKDDYVRYNLKTAKCDSEVAPAVSFISKFGACVAGTNYSGCPVGASLDTPGALFQGAGYLCCLPAEVVQPPQCGTEANGHEGQLLMQRRCGPGLNPQYFWETSNSCANSCGEKDEVAEWCNEKTFNYNVPGDLDGDVVHVVDGGCKIAEDGCAGDNCPFDAWTCMAECQAGFEVNEVGCECPLPDGAVAYWKLDGNAEDSVGGHDGTILGGVGFVDGQVREAGSFNGNGYIEIPNSASFGLTTFTLEAWVINSGVPQNSSQAIVARGEGMANGNANYSMYLMNYYNYPGATLFQPVRNSDATYLICAFERATDDRNYYIVSANPVPLGSFFHAVCTYTPSGQVGMYLNGNPIAFYLYDQGNAIASLAGLTPSTESSPVYIAGMYSSSVDGGGSDTVESRLNGMIDEVVIYNRVLTAAEVKARYDCQVKW